MIIVGIGHKSRQGKDEFANFLTTYLRVHTRNKRIFKVGFADILKGICHQLWGWAGVMDGDHYEKYPNDRDKPLNHFDPPKTVVDLWIEFGNHVRDFDEPTWINALFKGSQCDVLVIKDVRYPNECKAVHAHGGLLVKVNRPGFEGLPSVSDNALNDYTGWDRLIENDRDLQYLHALAENLAVTDILPKLG